jgi:succinyl-diaminopimelate desuccinylase
MSLQSTEGLTRTASLAAQLIAQPSITPDDRDCQRIIAQRLSRLGFRIEWFRRNGVTNLWARLGTGRPLICFAGHTDVVPTGPREQWLADPFAPTVRDGVLYGRGASDMKTSIAAFVTAVEDYLQAQAHPKGSIALMLTSDEEGPSVDGSSLVVEMLRERGEAIDYCVIGEPSSVDVLGDMIKIGRRGTLSGRVKVKGIQGHIAYPHLAANPIHAVAPALAELTQEAWDDGNENFPPTSFQVSNINSGTGAGNVIPGSLEMLFNFRYSTESTHQQLKERFTQVLCKHQVPCDIEWTGLGLPFLTAPGALVAATRHAIERVTGVAPALSCTGGTSDGRFIATWCDEVVEFGPTNATIHKINECVALAEIEPLREVYLQLMTTLIPA